MHYTDTDSNIDRKLCTNKKKIVILPHYIVIPPPVHDYTTSPT